MTEENYRIRIAYCETIKIRDKEFILYVAVSEPPDIYYGFPFKIAQESLSRTIFSIVEDMRGKMGKVEGAEVFDMDVRATLNVEHLDVMRKLVVGAYEAITSIRDKEKNRRYTNVKVKLAKEETTVELEEL